MCIRDRYLTDVVAVAVAAQQPVADVVVDDVNDIMGVNTRVDLAHLEAVARRRICEAHMLAGVTIVDPATTVIDPQVDIGRDTVIAPGTHLLGRTRIGAKCYLGPQVVIQDSTLGTAVRVEPFCVLSNATVTPNQTIAAFSRLTST